MKKKKEKSRYNLTQQFGNKLLPDNTTLGCSCDFIIGKTIFSYSVTPVTKKKLSLNPTKTQYYVIQTDSKQIMLILHQGKNVCHHTFLRTQHR